MPTMYTIVEIPNKGKGMRATIGIPLGTRILSESPLVELGANQDDAGIAKAMKDQQLSREDTRAIFSLQNRLAGSSTPLLGIVEVNAIPLDSPATRRYGLFKDAHQINHSCLPNTYLTWNTALHKITVHAIRDIKSGEEITRTYGNEFWPYETRQARILFDFKFKCICERCMKPLEIRAAADAILNHAMEIEGANNNASCNYLVNSPEKYLTNAKVTLELLTELRMSFTSLGYRTYAQAFKVAIAHGDEARASVFARKAFETRRIMEGDDNPQVMEVELFIKQPATHEGYGKLKNMQWKQPLCNVPEDLGTGKFEAWLWSPGWLGKRG